MAVRTAFTAEKAAADVPAVTLSPRQEIARYLQDLGWQRHYATPVAAYAASHGGGSAALARVKAAAAWLSGRGLSPSEAENMALMCKDLILTDASDMDASLGWLEGRCLSDALLRSLLAAEPSLLTYAPSSDGAVLQRGAARADVSIEGPTAGLERPAGAADSAVSATGPLDDAAAATQPQEGRVRVYYWREGAAFSTAPVSARAPPGET